MTIGLVASLFACGQPVDPSPGQPGAAFPHPDGYPDHGLEAVTDLAACGQCHAQGDRARGTAEGCQSCHAYPHAPGIARGEVHGGAWLDDPSRCTECHGTDGRRGPARIASAVCTSCHHVFPHATGFLDGHGAPVVQRGGPEACASCHPAGGGPLAGRCADCHAAYPHPEAWRATQAHGGTVDDTCTEGCHAPDGTKGPMCNQCHDLYPHPPDWTQGHLVPAQGRGEGACRTCHAEGTPEGPTIPVSCGASCHGGPGEVP